MSLNDKLNKLETNFGTKKDTLQTIVDDFEIMSLFQEALVPGKIVEIYGKESIGKTSLTLYLLGLLSSINMQSIYVDSEYSLDAVRTVQLKYEGLVLRTNKLDKLITFLEGLKYPIQVLAIDSLAGLIKNIGQLRKLIEFIVKNQIILICTNQIREDIKKHKIKTPSSKYFKENRTLIVQIVHKKVDKDNNLLLTLVKNDFIFKQEKEIIVKQGV